ncbi:MAG: hypothetical protein M0P91_07415 [Sulfuricurvum sp.]|uniref:Calx-beta domain-containing protein n=1 Tax=Sulfuricurvum sp. TaxID=2025608 RepID=UPI0025FAB7C1|nr:Calx-beta domain-containing protein [Sulfuricurvum sp.]MCK9373010.1 hypothetical protein [Sulfuricurvum sp.]
MRILTTGAIESDGNISGSVTLTHPYDSDLTIILHTEDGSATSAEDYYADSAITVRIAKGERQGNFTVKLKNDEKSEPTEAFTVKIDSVSTSGEPVAYTLLQDIQPFVIKDDDNTIKIRFSDAPQTEEKGEKLIFGVTLESTIPLDEALSIQTNLGAVTFEAGETFKTIDHTWQDDLKDEPDEIIELYPAGSYSPEHLKVSFENTATGTILDDDEPIEVTFSDAQAGEGDGEIVFTVTLSKALSKDDLTIDYETFDESATSGEDYSGQRGSITIPKGQTTAQITLQLLEDTMPEYLESFILSPSGRDYSAIAETILFKNQGMGTITDNDELGISVFGSIVKESDGIAKGAITLTQTFDHDIIVRLYTQDGSATEGEKFDYLSPGHDDPEGLFEVIVAANTDYASFDIKINPDGFIEQSEDFNVLVKEVVTYDTKTPIDFLMIDTQSTFIEGDDKIKIIVDDAHAVENEELITFTVRLENELQDDITINLAMLDGSAKLGLDYYRNPELSVFIPKHTKSLTYSVPLKNDESAEPTLREHFTLVPVSYRDKADKDILLTNSVSGKGTITDDDGTLTITISDNWAWEREKEMSFKVSIDSDYPLEKPLSVWLNVGNSPQMVVFNNNITQLSNNNIFKLNTFTFTSKSDTINNCFYLLNLNQRKSA